MTAVLRRCRGVDLDTGMLYELLRLRVEVFVVEQQCAYPELDGRDLLTETRHYWLEDSHGEVLSVLRLSEERGPSEECDETRVRDDEGIQFRIGRVCTRATQRRRGHTGRLLEAALAEVGERSCRLSAQTYLADMYARHGFARAGEEFVEDGIPHVPMLRA